MSEFPPAIEGTAAHLFCHVKSIGDAADAGHHLVVAQVERARVSKYYYDGKIFSPRDADRDGSVYPSLLTFLGSQTFGTLDKLDKI